MSILKLRLALGLLLCAIIGVVAHAYPGKSPSAGEDFAGTQDVRGLDRRISSLEQRLFSIESSINRLEQAAFSQRTPVSQPGAHEQEINLLRREIQTLQLRLNEIECGLVKLDERTSPSVREDRKSVRPRTTDPCRLNPAAPLRLTTRP